MANRQNNGELELSERVPMLMTEADKLKLRRIAGENGLGMSAVVRAWIRSYNLRGKPNPELRRQPS